MNFYDVNLAKELSGGGGSQPSGSIPISENGTYDVTAFAEAVVNVSGGGGGLEYESGIWSPEENTKTADIYFTNTHSVPPAVFVVTKNSTGFVQPETNVGTRYINLQRLVGLSYMRTSSSNSRVYGWAEDLYRSTTGSFVGGTSANLGTPDTSADSGGNVNSRYWVSEDCIHLHGGGYDYLATDTYKWIAIWAPTE